MNFESEEKEELELDSPSPALGRMIATAIHQVVTDPYLDPLEKLSQYLASDHSKTDLRVDLLTKWATDYEMPTCFVHDLLMGTTQIDHPASPWVLEEIVNKISIDLQQKNSNNLISVSTFVIDDEKYWLGFTRVPYNSTKPRQIAGVFFSIDSYLDSYVPRLINEMVNRTRFPIVEFQQNNTMNRNKVDGAIGFRILMSDNSEYFQQGRTFDSNKMIYAESQYYPEPVVCMQRGWDLQVFSSNVIANTEEDSIQINPLLLLLIELTLVTVLYWWVLISKNKKVKENK